MSLSFNTVKFQGVALLETPEIKIARVTNQVDDQAVLEALERVAKKEYWLPFIV